MQITRLFKEFFENEKSSGILLIFCTLASLVLSNYGTADAYRGLWETVLNGHTITHWINDGLMTLFFLLIGLELEREIYLGELSSLRDAMFPLWAALGGMLVPAGLYLLLNAGTDTAGGAGIPMATDIAFALAVLSLLGRRVPAALKVFLTALAVIDDLGAILVIAFFYTKNISWMHFGIAMSLFGVLLLLNRLRIHNLVPYLVGGVAMWYFMLHSGIHATITGVLVAFAIPFGDGSEQSVSYRLQRFLHKPVSFLILPLFALANTAIALAGSSAALVQESYAQGIALGLVIGKPLGVLLFTLLVCRIGLAQLPSGISRNMVLGTGLLAGIGFTMSIFITLLAFGEEGPIDQAKLAILVSSLVAALAGYLVLYKALPKNPLPEEDF